MQSTNHNSKQINAADGKREKIQSTNHKYRRPKARKNRASMSLMEGEEEKVEQEMGSPRPFLQ